MAGKHDIEVVIREIDWDPEEFKRRLKSLPAEDIFFFRMFAEGRIFEYHEKLNEAIERHKHSPPNAKKAVMSEMGFGGPESERDWYLRWLDKVSGDENKRIAAEKRSAASEKRRIRNIRRQFDDALKTLPPVGDPNQELEWVSSHSRMFRALEMWQEENKLLDDDLTVADIIDTEFDCPSRRAATMLRHWISKPEEFYKKHFDQIHRTATPPKPSSGTEDEDTQEAREIRRDAKKTIAEVEETIKILVSESLA